MRISAVHQELPCLRYWGVRHGKNLTAYFGLGQPELRKEYIRQYRCLYHLFCLFLCKNKKVCYEDKLGIYWEIKARGFKKKGCAVSCHMTENGMNNGIEDFSAGRKYTNKQGETIDMWHWKSVRTGPLGMIDDQFVDHTKDLKQNKNWGRKGDAKLGGGYKNNHNGSKTGPAYMNSPFSEADKYWVLPRTKTKFVDTFKTGDVVPGIEISPFKGSRADIRAKGVWKDGLWTLEIKRTLVTTGEKADVQDIQFRDLSKAYYFGLAVFDNTQINHLYHKGSIELNFQ